jgi:hypothetical protein
VKWLAVVSVLVLAAGCNFAFYESEVAIEPVPGNSAEQIVAGGELPANPEVQDTAGTVAILKLLPIKEALTGEGAVRNNAISTNGSTGFGVRYVTRRRFLVISGPKSGD